jgi:FAD synthase
MSNVAQTGIYFGYAQISPSGGQEPIADEDRLVFPMVMSLGYNPFYDNKTMTAVRVSLPYVTLWHSFLTLYLGDPRHAWL